MEEELAADCCDVFSCLEMSKEGERRSILNCRDQSISTPPPFGDGVNRQAFGVLHYKRFIQIET